MLTPGLHRYPVSGFLVQCIMSIYIDFWWWTLSLLKFLLSKAFYYGQHLLFGQQFLLQWNRTDLNLSVFLIVTWAANILLTSNSSSSSLDPKISAINSPTSDLKWHKMILFLIRKSFSYSLLETTYSSLCKHFSHFVTQYKASVNITLVRSVQSHTTSSRDNNYFY